MEKLQVALAWLKKYYFWVLLGIEVLVVLGLWFMVTSDLADQYSNREQRSRAVSTRCRRSAVSRPSQRAGDQGHRREAQAAQGQSPASLGKTVQGSGDEESLAARCWASNSWE